MNKREFIKSQKDCASMLGMSLKEYNDYRKNIKVIKRKPTEKKYDNHILKVLGIDEKMLKKSEI